MVKDSENSTIKKWGENEKKEKKKKESLNWNGDRQTLAFARDTKIILNYSTWGARGSNQRGVSIQLTSCIKIQAT